VLHRPSRAEGRSGQLGPAEYGRAAAGTGCASAGTRIKEVVSIEGVRENYLMGYGVV